MTVPWQNVLKKNYADFFARLVFLPKIFSVLMCFCWSNSPCSFDSWSFFFADMWDFEIEKLKPINFYNKTSFDFSKILLLNLKKSLANKKMIQKAQNIEKSRSKTRKKFGKCNCWKREWAFRLCFQSFLSILLICSVSVLWQTITVITFWSFQDRTRQLGCAGSGSLGNKIYLCLTENSPRDLYRSLALRSVESAHKSHRVARSQAQINSFFSTSKSLFRKPEWVGAGYTTCQSIHWLKLLKYSIFLAQNFFEKWKTYM